MISCELGLQEKDTNILVKISGEATLPQNIDDLIANLKRLIEQLGINITLPYGAGKQIDIQWKASGNAKERPKRDGVGITTNEVLEEAVLPAEKAVQSILCQKLEGIDLKVLPRGNICGEIKDFDKMQYTGTPTGIKGLDFKKSL